MKASNRWILLIVIGALVLQGCAETGGSKPDAPQVASMPAQTMATSAPAAKSTSIALPAKAGDPVVKADTKENFEAVVAAIQQQMKPGGRWQYVDATGRSTVDARFADMRALFDKFGSVDKMDGSTQSRLLDDQNAINGILAKDDGNRMVCEHVAPTGSHITQTVCRTYSQIRKDQQNGEFNMRIQDRQSRTQKVSGH